MRLMRSKENPWPADCLRFLPLGLLTLLLLAAPGRGQSARHPAQAQVAGRPASGLHQASLAEPSDSGWRPARPQCPLPPASAFDLQTNLRKYLETWPTPGATSTDDWPEYAGESDQELD